MRIFKKKPYRVSTLQKKPRVLLWEPRQKTDLIIEIQDPDHTFTDEVVNELANFADDLTLTQPDPVRPQIELSGNPFTAMQTSMVFLGTSEEAKWSFLAAFQRILKKGKAVTPRKKNNPSKK